MLFARSLHYQFYAWYAHQLVFLAWHTPYDLLQRCASLFPRGLSWPTSWRALNPSFRSCCRLFLPSSFVRRGVHRFAILAVIEYGWNTFPSTVNSSMGLTFANAFLLVGVYYGMPTGLRAPATVRSGRGKME